MTKQEMINKIDGISDDILQEAYAFDIVQTGQIQMNFNLEVLKKHCHNIRNLRVDPTHGYLKFEINSETICMT